jgi:hypothetical protein
MCAEIDGIVIKGKELTKRQKILHAYRSDRKKQRLKGKKEKERLLLCIW